MPTLQSNSGTYEVEYNADTQDLNVTYPKGGKFTQPKVSQAEYNFILYPPAGMSYGQAIYKITHRK